MTVILTCERIAPLSLEGSKAEAAERLRKGYAAGGRFQIGLSGMRYRARTRNTASSPQCSGSSRI